MKNLIILGAGGSGVDIISIVKAVNSITPTWNLLGFLDDNRELHNTEICNLKVLGSIEDSDRFSDTFFISSIAHPHNRRVRRQIWDKIKSKGGKFATLIHPTAILYEGVIVKEGTVVNANCVLGSKAVLMEDVYLAYACNVAHETILGEHTTLGTGANLASGIKVGEDCYIGAGVSASHDIDIEDDTLIAIGSAVASTLKNNPMKIWIGVPAIPIKEFFKK